MKCRRALHMQAQQSLKFFLHLPQFRPSSVSLAGHA
jgi:hypothetical protein